MKKMLLCSVTFGILLSAISTTFGQIGSPGVPLQSPSQTAYFQYYVFGKIVLKGSPVLSAMGASGIRKNAKVKLGYEVPANGQSFYTQKTGGSVTISNFTFDGVNWVASYHIQNCPVSPNQKYTIRFDLLGLPNNMYCHDFKAITWDMKSKYNYDFQASVKQFQVN